MKVTPRLQELAMQLMGYTTKEAYEAQIDARHPVESCDWEYHRRAKKSNPPAVTIINGTGAWTVSLTVGNYNALTFQLRRYPACCGALLFHHFQVNSDCWKDTSLFPLFMDEFFNTFDNVLTWRGGQPYRRDISIWGGDMYMNNRRIIVVMVETRTLPQDTPADAELEFVDDPKIQHKPLFDYFHSQKKVNTRLMYNTNSGNVLHDMEVILKDKPQ